MTYIKHNVLLVFPIFNKDGEVETKNQKTVKDWLKKNEQRFYNEFSVGFNPMICGVGVPSEGVEFLKLSPKAEVVRHAFSQMFEEDQQKKKIEKYDYVICIDGDGDINFDYIFEVLEALLGGNKAVFSCRQGNYGLKPVERSYIEYFENGILEIFFKTRVPDGQCGCYGFHNSIIKKLSLTATNFDIELDLLINILQREEELTYIPIKIEQEEERSNFTFEKNIEKLEFINKKLCLNKYFLKEYYVFFQKKFGWSLPDEYVAHFEKIQTLSTWELPGYLEKKQQPICHKQKGKRCIDCDYD